MTTVKATARTKPVAQRWEPYSDLPKQEYEHWQQTNSRLAATTDRLADENARLTAEIKRLRGESRQHH